MIVVVGMVVTIKRAEQNNKQKNEIKSNNRSITI